MGDAEILHCATFAAILDNRSEPADVEWLLLNLEYSRREFESLYPSLN